MKLEPHVRRFAMLDHAARALCCTALAFGRAAAALVLLALPIDAAAQARIGDVAQASIRSPSPYPGGSSTTPQIVWQHTIHHPGATFLKIRFARVAVLGSVDGSGVPCGDYVVVRDPDGAQREILSGLRDAEVWTRSVRGDTVIVELHADADGTAAGIEIDAYGHGEAPLHTRSICGTDESTGICDAVEQSRVALADPVGRILFASDCGGLFLCTGFLFSPDGLVMTNAHCANSVRESRSMEMWLNYTQFDEEPREPDCSLPERPNPDVFRAGKLILSDCSLDVAVHQMDLVEKGNPASLYGFLPLSARVPVAGEPIWVPQHPSGLPKRIAETGIVASSAVAGFDFCSDQPACSYDGVPTGHMTEVLHTADTGPGASGSPVLDAADQVIALHHAGGCSSGGGANAAVLMAHILPRLGKAPRGRLTTQPRRRVGDAPLALSFDASESFDPDGGAIASYELDPGDGSPLIVASTPLILHVYTVAGRFKAALRVVDDEGTRSKRPFIRRVRVRSPG